MESCSVPPGFRFHPTDEELVGYYLRKKVASQKINLDVTRDIDLYKIEPWDLQEQCRIGYEEQNEWYFFSHKDKKYPTGTRTNRATMAGFWKATGRDKAVYDKTKLIGMRKTLVFYKGRAPNGKKSYWIIHEYRLESDENAPAQPYHQFIQLPQLQSPSSLPVMKRPSSSMSISSMDNNNNYLTSLDNEASFDSLISGDNKKKKTKQVMMTGDWRELEKFVASQLMSQEDHGASDLIGHHMKHEEMEMDSSMLNEREEENRFISQFLNHDCMNCEGTLGFNYSFRDDHFTLY